MGDFDNILNTYLGYVDSVKSLIPYKRLGAWKDFFLNPTKVTSSSKDNVGTIIVDLYVVRVISFIISFLAVILPIAVSQLIMGAGAGALLTVGILLAVLFGVLIILPILQLLYAGLEFVIAKLLGGQAPFSRHFFASVMPALAVFTLTLPLVLIEIPFQWFTYIPIAGAVCSCLTIPISIISGLFGLYGLYLKFLSFKQVHKVSDLRSIGIIVIPPLLLLAVALLVFVLFYAAIIGYLTVGQAIVTPVPAPVN